MIDLNLEEDERVILDSIKIKWLSDGGRNLDRLVLTNKGIYCVYKTKNGLFAKSEDMIYRFELDDILVDDNNCSQIRQTRIDGDRSLEIRFRHGMEYFSFERLSKNELQDWIAGLNYVLGTEDLAAVQRAQGKELIGNIAGQVVDGLAGMIGTSSEKIYDKLEKISGKTMDRVKDRMSRTGSTQQGNASRSPRQPGQRQYPGQAQQQTQQYSSQSGQTQQYSSQPGQTQQTPPPQRSMPQQEQAVKTPPPVPQKRYHLALNGQPQGPFDTSEMKLMAMDGKINRSTLAWTKGMEKWLPMEEIEDLKNIAESIPPALF